MRTDRSSDRPPVPVMRTDLGDGWYLVSDPADPYNADDPERTLIRVEGPGGIVARFPFDQRYAALAALGIRRRRHVIRERPGPGRRIAPESILKWVLDDLKAGRRPTRARCAGELGVNESTIQRTLEDVPTTFTDVYRALRTAATVVLDDEDRQRRASRGQVRPRSSR